MHFAAAIRLFCLLRVQLRGSSSIDTSEKCVEFRTFGALVCQQVVNAIVMCLCDFDAWWLRTR